MSKYFQSRYRFLPVWLGRVHLGYRQAFARGHRGHWYSWCGILLWAMSLNLHGQPVFGNRNVADQGEFQLAIQGQAFQLEVGKTRYYAGAGGLALNYQYRNRWIGGLMMATVPGDERENGIDLKVNTLSAVYVGVVGELEEHYTIALLVGQSQLDAEFTRRSDLQTLKLDESDTFYQVVLQEQFRRHSNWWWQGSYTHYLEEGDIKATAATLGVVYEF